MPFLRLYGLFFLGILLSVVFPVAVRWVLAMTDTMEHGAWWDRVVTFAKPYVMLAVGSAVIGFMLVLAFLQMGGDTDKVTWFNAVIYGYGWDSTLQKFRQGLKRDQPLVAPKGSN